MEVVELIGNKAFWTICSALFIKGSAIAFLRPDFYERSRIHTFLHPAMLEVEDGLKSLEQWLLCRWNILTAAIVHYGLYQSSYRALALFCPWAVKSSNLVFADLKLNILSPTLILWTSKSIFSASGARGRHNQCWVMINFESANTRDPVHFADHNRLKFRPPLHRCDTK